MPPGYKLPINAAELDALIDKMGTLRDTAKDASSAMDGLAGSTSRVGRANPGGGSGGGGSSVLRARAYRPVGPFGRVAYEADRLSSFQEAGYSETSDAIRNQRYKLALAERAEVRAAAKPQSQEQRVFNRTRFLQADGSNPLGVDLASWGKMGKLPGSETVAEAGRAGMSIVAELLPALGGIAAGIASVVKVTQMAAESVSRSNSFVLNAGGSGVAMGQAYGLAGGDSARPGAIGDALRKGSFGAAYMHSKGIYDLGPFQIDKSSNYIGVMDNLRTEKDRNTRIRVARDLGITDSEFATSYADQQVYDELKRSRGDIGSDEALRLQGNFSGRQEITKNNLQRAWSGPGMHLMNTVGTWATGIGQMFGPRSFKDIGIGMAKAMFPMFMNPNLGYDDAPAADSKPGSGSRSIRYRTSANESIGGGSRTGQAASRVGSAYNRTSEDLDSEAYRIGAY